MYTGTPAASSGSYDYFWDFKYDADRQSGILLKALDVARIKILLALNEIESVVAAVKDGIGVDAAMEWLSEEQLLGLVDLPAPASYSEAAQ